ncbi:glycosyltransferase [Burkholderiales bacterium JOSHI_001]|nr:glycosyltransferase [Burkholderiales bacterium JOSHI_001]
MHMPLRILIAHNTYQQRGGEDAVVEAEVALLRAHGHEVRLYQRSNDDINSMSKASAALQTLWSSRTQNDAAALFAQFQPQVLHAHNTFPLISPSLYWAAARARVPVVQTLHNFRLICPQALLMREGQVCEDCVGHIPWRAARHACYRSSVAQSAVVAGMVQMHRALGTWQHKVARYIALNAFCRDRFVAGGLPRERIRIKPNFVDLPEPPAGPRQGLLFVGRLSEEKGVGVLAAAAAMGPPGMSVQVVGGGPLQSLLQASNQVSLLGALAPAEVYQAMGRARALLVPSIWYENFPRTVVEAFACGTPVIASRIGALATLVDDGRTGLLFKPGDAADLAVKMAWAQAHPDEMAAMGRQARAHYERELTGESNQRQLLAIYDEAMAEGPA